MENKEKEEKKKENPGISPISGQKRGELQSMPRETYETTVIEIKRAIFLGKRFSQRTLFFPLHSSAITRKQVPGRTEPGFRAAPSRRCAKKFWISRVFNFHRDSP